MKKSKPRTGRVIDGETLREYQEPELFKRQFQRSRECATFRSAWGIPSEGFADTAEREAWWRRLREKNDAYVRSDQFTKKAGELRKKRRAWADGKLSKDGLEMAELECAFRMPLVKYDFDIDRVVARARRPEYWREFIEDCLLFREVDPFIMRRPLPEPRLRWSNAQQRNLITIENIFADTVLKDFQSPDFSAKLRRLQKKLPGCGSVPRGKKNFNYAWQLIELDSETTLKDYEKAERIEGEIGGLDFGPIENKRAVRVRQVRHRAKKLVFAG